MKKWPIIALKFALLASSPWWAASCANQGVSSMSDPGNIHPVDPLKDFYVGREVDVRGLGTSAALEKLKVAYENTCFLNGEKPMKLAFKVPPGHERPLDLRLSKRQPFENSVYAIAAAARLEVDRSGATYRFKAPRENGQLVKQTFAVPPDFTARLNPDHRPMSAQAAFKAFGLDLDESTQVSLTGAKLDVESRSAEDMAAISSTVKMMDQGTPVQQRISTRVVELPAASKVAIPHSGSLDPKAASRLLADLAKEPGTEWGVLTPFTMRVGEDAKVSFGKTKLQVKTDAVGLGHQLQTAFSYRPAGRDSRRTEIRDSGYAMDGGSRLVVQTHRDGSRTVFLVETTFLDATGRPIRQENRKQELPAAVDVSQIVFR